MKPQNLNRSKKKNRMKITDKFAKIFVRYEIGADLISEFSILREKSIYTIYQTQKNRCDSIDFSVKKFQLM